MKLTNWAFITDKEYSKYVAPELQHFHLKGNVIGHPDYNAGDPITTSRVISITDKDGYMEVTTKSGSVYELYAEDIDIEYKNFFPHSDKVFTINTENGIEAGIYFPLVDGKKGKSALPLKLQYLAERDKNRGGISEENI